MYGWTPTEVHTPQPDGTVVVTRDSPWDDDEREVQFSYDAAICPSCGNLRSVCSDPATPWYPQRSICYASAALDVVQRRLALGHKTPGWEPHETDGANVYVSRVDVNPDDDFIPKKARD